MNDLCNRILDVHYVLVAFEVARMVMGPVVLVFTAVGDEVGTLAECFPTILCHYSHLIK